MAKLNALFIFLIMLAFLFFFYSKEKSNSENIPKTTISENETTFQETVLHQKKINTESNQNLEQSLILSEDTLKQLKEAIKNLTEAKEQLETENKNLAGENQLLKEKLSQSEKTLKETQPSYSPYQSEENLRYKTLRNLVESRAIGQMPFLFTLGVKTLTSEQKEYLKGLYLEFDLTRGEIHNSTTITSEEELLFRLAIHREKYEEEFLKALTPSQKLEYEQLIKERIPSESKKK